MDVDSNARHVFLGGLDPRVLYAAIVQSHWGDLALTRVLPAYFFGLFAAAKISALVVHVQNGGEITSLPSLAYLLQQGAASLFMVLLVVLYLTRRPTVGRHSSLAHGVVALSGTFILNAAGAMNVADGQTAVLLASAALVLAGTGFAIVSLAFLGRCFGIMPEARGLVRRGPYRWIRHPVYLGEVVSALGLVVATGSLPPAALFVAFCGLQYWRATLEERVLEATFPEYGEYRRSTYRLLPGLH